MLEGDQVPFVLTAGIFLRKNPEPVDCHGGALPSGLARLERTISHVPPLSILLIGNRHGGQIFTTATLEARRTAEARRTRPQDAGRQ